LTFVGRARPDDWRVRKWLALNLGLRHDYYSPMTEQDNQTSNVDLAAGKILTAGQGRLSQSAGGEADRGNFSPRIGFAATLGSDTVVRGGYVLPFSPPFVGTPLAFRNPAPGPAHLTASTQPVPMTPPASTSSRWPEASREGSLTMECSGMALPGRVMTNVALHHLQGAAILPRAILDVARHDGLPGGGLPAIVPSIVDV
jgi:hypothetical protein